MSDLDFEALGFKCGIEIHQQLDTEEKLFCACATTPGNEQRVDDVMRKLRPVASELGEVDEAAQYEYLKKRSFQYNVYTGTSCLVELDEEPPHPLNQDALDIGLEAALRMGCSIPDEIHVMRKTVIDGSNTAGFQRTAIIGLDGSIETSEGVVGIDDIELEEESAGIHSRDEEKGVFDLDRLGIPLIEVGTDASINNPEHAKEVAEHLGMLLRSSGKVKRGLGTIRQDVNVSIEDGARVEIKGFQELNLLDDLVRNEVERQHSLVQLMDDLPDTVGGEIHDVTDTFADTGNDIIERVIDSDGVVLAFILHGLEGYLKQDLSPGLHLGRELADYAVAQSVNGIMHTDEDLSRYGLKDAFQETSKELGKTDGDVVIVIADEQERAQAAAAAVIDRANLLPSEVPEETRTADDTITRYARPLPGEARMYPETDIPPIVMEQDRLDAIDIPETLEEKEERLEQDIGKELAAQIVASSRLPTFEELVEQYDVEPRLVANLLTNVIGAVEADDQVTADHITADHLDSVVAAMADGDIAAGQLEDLLRSIAAEPEEPVSSLLDRFTGTGEDEIRTVVQEVIDEKQELVQEQGEHAKGALMGLVMERLEGADGAAVSRILAEELEKQAK